VNFSSLIEYGKDFSINTCAFLEQWRYLLLSDIIEEINQAESDLEKASIRSLILPGVGFGSNFHVLIQAKNIIVNNGFKYSKKSADMFNELIDRYPM